MVLLRSGKSYLDKKHFNNKVDNFNELILHITKNLKINDYKSFLKNLTHIKPNIYKDFNEIIYLNRYTEIFFGAKGGKYFIIKKKKYYITHNNKNTYLRNEKLDEIAILISKFLKNYTKLIKNHNQISSDYVKLCSICYSDIEKGDKIVMCNTRTIFHGKIINNIIHPFHKTCFDANIQYADVPYNCKTKINGDVIKLYECPYCRQKKINILKVHTVN